MAGESIVSVLRTRPETVIEDYAKLMTLAEYTKHIKKSIETVVKLNLSWSLYYPACSTEPWQLEGCMKKLLDDGYRNLHFVENKTVVTNVWKGALNNRWLPVLRKYGQKYEPLTEAKWEVYEPKSEMVAIPHIFPDGLKIPVMFIGKNVIHLPTVKTHGHTTITGAIKNAFGGLITERRHHSHRMIHEVIVDLLAIQKEIHPGMFAVMDGTVCGNGAGPRTMTPEIKNIILASADQVAIDAVSAKMMGFEPMKIPFIKQAHDRGLGTGDIDQIEIAGMPRSEFNKINFRFSTRRSPVIYFDQLFRKKHSFLERLVFRTGLFKLAVFGSAFYHDYFWYPTAGRRMIKQFMKTEWGKMFRRY